MLLILMKKGGGGWGGVAPSPRATVSLGKRHVPRDCIELHAQKLTGNVCVEKKGATAGNGGTAAKGTHGPLKKGRPTAGRPSTAEKPKRRA
jgi:hypothetical protein